MLAAGALASAAAASTLATPASGATSLPYLLAQPVCTDGTATTGDLLGGSLNANHQFRVLVDGSGQQVASGVTSATGSFVAEAVTLPAATGPIVLLLQLAIIETGWVDTATRTVGRCTIAADPGSVELAELPRSVHVTGAGWPRSQTVRFAVDGVQGPSVVAPPSGDIASDVSIPVRPCGPVPLRAQMLEPPPPVISVVSPPTEFAPGVPFRFPRASTTVTVVCPEPTPTPTDIPTTTPTPVDTPTPVLTPTPTPTLDETPTPTLTVDPLVMSGGVGMARGDGFQPGATVVLTWTLPSGTKAPGGSSAVADAQGRFVAQCLVLPRAMLGPRSLRAVQTAPSGQLAAAATTLVVSGPMEPGRNRLLGRR